MHQILIDNDLYENFNLGLQDIDSYEILINDTYYSSQAALRKTTIVISSR